MAKQLRIIALRALLSIFVYAFGALAQPVITTDLTNETLLAGSSAVLSVAVSNSSPVTYTWQLNGVNLPGYITTIAGNGTAGYSGDNGRATNASLTNAVAVAVDVSGNVFIADASNNRIRKVNPAGIITTAAGTGQASYSGDKGYATNAALNDPRGVAVDSAGQLYIADTGNNRIRRVGTNGIIATIAGNGTPGYNGDGIAATSAELQNPIGMWVDLLTNVFFADTENQRVRVVYAEDGYAYAGDIETIAGNGFAGTQYDNGPLELNTPLAVAVDLNNDVLIADTLNNRILDFTTMGSNPIVAGAGTPGFSGDGGPVAQAQISDPRGVAVDGSFYLYISDSSNNRIRRVGPNSIAMTNSLPGGPPIETVVNYNGTITTVAGNGTAGFSGDGGVATSASLNLPYGIAVDASGDLFICDARNNRIREAFPYRLTPGLALNNISAADAGSYDVIVTGANGSVTSSVVMVTVVSAPAVSAIQPLSQSVTAGSTVAMSVSASGTAPLSLTWFQNATNAVQTGASETLTLNDATTNETGSYTVVVTNAYGSVTSSIATLNIGSPPTLVTQTVSALVLPGSNVLLSVTATGTGPLIYQWRYNGTNLPTNIIETFAGGGESVTDNVPATNYELIYPTGVASDAMGDLFIAQNSQYRVRKVAPSGIITDFAGSYGTQDFGDGESATNASLAGADCVAVDLTGSVYVGTPGRVRKITPDGIIHTVAGTNGTGYSGDGGSALNAKLDIVQAVACDTAGNLYIGDFGNHRVRKVGVNGIITTVAGNGLIGGLVTNTPATNAYVVYPYGIAVDAVGNLYISDPGNFVVWFVGTDGMISIFAGTGARGNTGDGGWATNATLGYPEALVLDASDNLYIDDHDNSNIRMVGTNGHISTIAGTGLAGFSGDGAAATSARLNDPQGICLDSAGNFYISDYNNLRVREIQYAGRPTLLATNAGDYMVFVSSPYGSVASSVIPVDLFTQPQITGIAIQPSGNITLNFTGAPNSSHSLWFTTNLTPPVVWTRAASAVANGSGAGQLTDTNAQGAACFYRVSFP